MLQDKTVTFSVYLKGDANYDDVRIALLSWTGTANAPTDPVSSWGSSGTNPTWATSWTAENTPADLSITTGWVKYSVTAALDTAAINNLAVVVFSNSTTPTSSDSLYIALAQLEVGSEGTDFDIRQRADELQMCERFYQTGAGASDAYWNGNTTSGSTYKYGVRFRCTMAKTPVVTLTNASASGFGTTPGTPAVTTEGFQEGRAATSTANASYFSSDWTSDGEL
jgi:hypothetical protein